jgi:tRNA nucleotidyltransferase (CCA-adding enzyme)
MAPSDTPIQLRPPAGVLEIVKDLENAGHQAWCVGGAVRDALMGHAHLDWDLATNATPDQVQGVFGRRRTIPVGIEFGTVGVLDRAGVLHEVTTFRRDVRTDGRHAEVEFGASLDEDLARRDFTVNAIAYSPTRRVVHDPFAGRADIEGRIIRSVGDPEARMREDRLRALRGIRFAARLGFDIERATWDAIRHSAPHLNRLSAERVKQELEKTMDQIAHPSGAIARWQESGALEILVPELASLSEEARAALDCAAPPGLVRRPGRRLTRFAVLFSDCEPEAALHAATRLRFSKSESQWIATMVRLWKRTGAAMAERFATGTADAVTVRRWVSAISRTMLPGFFRVAAARWAARRQRSDGTDAPAVRAVQRLYRRCLSAAQREPIDLRDLAIDGDDLRQAGIAPGPELGKILAALLERVLEEPSRNTRDWLVDEAVRLRVATTTDQ